MIGGSMSVLLSELEKLSGSDFLIAYSGGLDSHVLLHAMAMLQNKRALNLRAVHIHHGLSKNADTWMRHCEQVCADLNVPFEAYSIEVNPIPGESLEAVAREKRYAIFSAILKKDEYLLTAHTQSDQAETLLLQAMRGAGVRGLSAMPSIKTFSVGAHARPLLNYSRSALESYASKNHLQWIEDESNTNTQFDRNFIRHDVLPLLKTHWPSVEASLSRVAKHNAEAAVLLDELAVHDFSQLYGADMNLESIEINPLLTLSIIRRRNLIRYWLRVRNFPMPSAKKLEQVELTVLHAKHDANPLVQWADVDIRRFDGKLYAMKQLQPHDVGLVLKWNLGDPLVLPNELGVLNADDIFTEEQLQRLDKNKITVRFRQGGEMLKPAGRNEMHTLKHLFQEWGVPVWERDRIPLIFQDENLIAVVGYGCD